MPPKTLVAQKQSVSESVLPTFQRPQDAIIMKKEEYHNLISMHKNYQTHLESQLKQRQDTLAELEAKYRTMIFDQTRVREQKIKD